MILNLFSETLRIFLGKNSVIVYSIIDKLPKSMMRLSKNGEVRVVLVYLSSHWILKSAMIR